MSARINSLGKLRLSLSAVLLAGTAMLSAEWIRHQAASMDRRLEIFEIAIGAGLVLWAGAHFLQRRANADDEESPFRFLMDGRYWGVMGTLVALVFFVSTQDYTKVLARAGAAQASRARGAPVSAAQAPGHHRAGPREARVDQSQTPRIGRSHR